MRVPLVSLFGLVLAASLFGGRADARDPRHTLNFSVDLRDYYLRTMPPFRVGDPLVTPLREVSGSLPSTGAQQFLGVAVDATYVLRQTWEFPLIGIVGAGAIGSSPRVVSSLDGSIVTMRPWSSGAMTILLPGVGLRLTERRWKFSLDVRAVTSLVWMNVTVANGGTSVDPTPRGADNQSSGPSVLAATFGARASLEACRRLDPVQRACIFVEPHLYEYRFMNGFSAGLRLEFGP